MAAIKRFFEKRKLDIKFKKAGEGRRMTTDGSSSSITASSPANVTSVVRPVAAPTDEQIRAADAALARMNLSKSGGANKAVALKAKVRMDMESEKAAVDKAMADAARYTGPQQVQLDAAPVAGKVLFRCPLINPDLQLPKQEMEIEIENFLLSQLAEEPAMTAALMIYTLNKSNEAVKQCIETIQKYLDNIAVHPDEDKYRRIRLANKVLQERVLAMKGAEEFLQAVGFRKSQVENADGNVDSFLIFDSATVSGSTSISDWCSEMKELLNNAESIRPELDRDIRVFKPSPNAARITVPDEFYRMSPEELKKEQQIRAEAVEQFGMLRTKQMRERDRIRELRRYRYCLIRIRFPDGIILQGTFAANDRLSVVLAFVMEALADEWLPFYLTSSTGQRLVNDNESMSLAELDMAPASLLNFSVDADVLNDLVADAAVRQGISTAVTGPFLKPGLMALIRSL